ncbi:MAG: ATP-binding protein [Peptostreptococcaceae bacterium]
MQSILDIVNDYIIVLDKFWNIQFCNKKLLSKLKFNLGELKNKSIEKIINNNVQDLNIDIKKLNRQNNLKLDLELQSKYEEGLPVCSEIVLSDFDGEESIFIVSKDRCEKYYKREELEKILENIQLNCWLKNMNGEYVYLNESYANEIGHDRLNILGKKTSEFWEENESDLFTSMDREVIESKKFQLTEHCTKQGDDELWVEIYKAPILNNDDDVEYIIGFTKDITLHKKLENEMHANNKELNSLNHIMMDTHRKHSICELLKNVCENIQDYFECDGVSIFVLDKDKEKLKVAMKCGLSTIYDANSEVLNIDSKELSNLSKFKYLNKISNVEDINHQELRKHLEKNNIDTIGVFEISFNNEIIGFLILKFLENSTLKFNKFDYLKTISSNIATMIKTQTLSKELHEEFNKRRKIEKELELLLDISVDLIARGNLNGDIQYVNNKWKNTLGWTEEELLHMNIEDIIHDNFKNGYRRIMQGVRSDTGFRVSKMICKDGNEKWIEINYKIIRDEDKFIITAKDVSEQKKQDEERKFLKEAVQMESLKNEFFANISHEFRTPLNIILGTMQLMQRNVENGKISWHESLSLESHINYIKQNSYRLLRLVNNLIDITSIESGYYKLQLGNYDIVEVVENITLSVAQYTKDNGINLIFDTNCEEKIIACDPEKIERVVLNLLSNATKYTDTNGDIYVDLHVEDEKIKISVKDDGVGISKDKIDIIFDRFKKIDNNLNRKCEGSGIGLSLVKSLVELQGGDIYVESELGEGSTFTFELPLRYLDDSSKTIQHREISKSSQIEKCNIEFSDIYS